MKSFARLSSVCAILLAGVVQAQELAPVPDMHIPAIPYVDQSAELSQPAVGEPVVGEPVVFVDPVVYTGTIFTRVKYTDVHEMSPCAQPKLIMVKNPCADEGCCEPAMVCIEICVPTCGCEEVTCRRFGNRIRYDYGKYAVDVRVKRDHIQVDYQD